MSNDAQDPCAEQLQQLSAELSQIQQELDVSKEEKRRVDSELEKIKAAHALAETAIDAAKQEAQGAKSAAAQEQKRLTERETQLRREAAELSQQRAESTKEIRRLEALKMEAQHDFFLQNQAALSKLLKDRDALTQEITALTQQINALKSSLASVPADAQERFDKEFAAQRKRSEDALVRELEARRKSHDAEFATRLKTFEADLDQRHSIFEEDFRRREEALAQQQQALAEGNASVQTKRAEIETAAVRLKVAQEALVQDKRELDARLTQLRAKLQTEHDASIAALEKRLDQAQRDRTRIENQNADLRAMLSRFGSDDPESFLQRQRALEEENMRLKEDLAQRPTHDALQELDALRTEKRDWTSQRNGLRQTLAELEGKQSRWLLSVSALENQRDLHDAEKARRQALEATLGALQKEVDQLNGILNPKERASRVSIIEKPVFTDQHLARISKDAPAESTWLKGIADSCELSGFVFPDRLLKAFHTALKTSVWSPLTVLAGVSGTGKSALPKLYARFGGLLSQTLPVQPNWDSPQSLFGYFNSIDNLYDATPLLRAMAQMCRSGEDGLEDHLLLVLLDEMNLAHVELYFSDLLSKLEERRGNDEVMLEIKLGAGTDDYKLALRNNVLWVGTMNEDETTKSLSDKVLDRGHLISFPRPHHLQRRISTELAAPGALLKRAHWDAWIEPESDLSENDIKKYKDALEVINHHLEHVGRALGHRVWQGIEQYMANHPDVRAARVAAGEETSPQKAGALRLAFEDAVVQKVMPKLRGIETSGDARQRCLDPIRKTLGDLDLDLGEDFKLACSGSFGFVWKSARYLDGGAETAAA